MMIASLSAVLLGDVSLGFCVLMGSKELEILVIMVLNAVLDAA